MDPAEQDEGAGLSFQRKLAVPPALSQFDATDIRTQYAALCYRIVNDKIRVLLITSRGTKRWIVPKGWPMAKKDPHEAALQEAAEAGSLLMGIHTSTGKCKGSGKAAAKGKACPREGGPTMRM